MKKYLIMVVALFFAVVGGFAFAQSGGSMGGRGMHGGMQGTGPGQ